VGVSPYTVWRTLKEQALHPIHIRLVQGLKLEDLPKRVRFCEWLLEKKNEEEPQFIERLLTTDEATFAIGMVFSMLAILISGPMRTHMLFGKDTFKTDLVSTCGEE
jgi:hypothetical protein